jgi:hypothetical protein
MNKLKKLSIPSLLLMGVAASPLTMAQGSFDGHDVTVKFEMWQVDADKNITEVLAVRNEAVVSASDVDSPDEEGFHAMDTNFHLWDIDFNKQAVDLTFRSIEIQDNDNQYMYMSPVGFHIQDTTDELSDILYVELDDQFAPPAFNKDLLRFDANNIYVNLQGSMCHIAGMGGMPECNNDSSPTGYNNTIKLNVLFADTADALFTWLESEYGEYLPSHQMSMQAGGYYYRFYRETGIYIATKEGHLYAASEELGILDLGAIQTWMDKMPMDMHDHDMTNTDGCAEGQHMMPDGTCMNNSAM